MVTMKMEGANDLLRQVRRYSLAKQGQAIRLVHFTTIQVQNKARENAPKDTSTLARSISRRFEDGGRTGIVFTNVVYALRQEKGFVGTDSLGRTYNQPGKHYMRTALITQTAQFASNMKGIFEGKGFAS